MTTASFKDFKLDTESIAMLATTVFGFECPEVVAVEEADSGEYWLALCFNDVWFRVSISQVDSKGTIEPLY